MSAIPFDQLKGSKDLSLPFISRPERVGVVPISHDTLIEFGFLVKTLRIINESASSSIRYTINDPVDLTNPNLLLKEVPPNSDETIDGWFSIFQIIPDPITGKGSIEMDLTKTIEALK